MYSEIFIILVVIQLLFVPKTKKIDYKKRKNYNVWKFLLPYISVRKSDDDQCQKQYF